MEAHEKAPQTSAVAGHYMKNEESASVDGVQTQCKDTKNLENRQVFVAPDNIDREALMALVENAICNADDAANVLDTLNHCYVSGNEPIEKESHLFKINGVPAITPELTIIKGAPKRGKGLACSLFVKAFLSGSFGSITYNGANTDRCVYFDTEQSRNQTRKVIKRVTDGKDFNDRLIAVNTKLLDYKQRLMLLTALCLLYSPKMIILDGLVDMVQSMQYNDVETCSEIVNTISTLCERYNVAIVCVMHTNKRDDFASGWLGRLALQKCALELQVSREGKSPMRTLECADSRGREVPSVNFTIDDTPDGCGELRIIGEDEINASKQEATRETYRTKLMELGIDPPMCIRREALTSLIRDKKSQIDGKQCRANTASNLVKRCLDCGALRVDGDNILFDYYDDVHSSQ